MKTSIKRTLAIIGFYVVFSTMVQAQFIYSHAYVDVIETSDGNYLALEIDISNNDTYLVKIDANTLNQIWRRRVNSNSTNYKKNNLVEIDAGYVLAESRYTFFNENDQPKITLYNANSGVVLSDINIQDLVSSANTYYRVDAIAAATTGNNELIIGLYTDDNIQMIRTSGFSSTLIIRRSISHDQWPRVSAAAIDEILPCNDGGYYMVGHSEQFFRTQPSPKEAESDRDDVQLNLNLTRSQQGNDDYLVLAIWSSNLGFNGAGILTNYAQSNSDYLDAEVSSEDILYVMYKESNINGISNNNEYRMSNLNKAGGSSRDILLPDLCVYDFTLSCEDEIVIWREASSIPDGPQRPGLRSNNSQDIWVDIFDFNRYSTLNASFIGIQNFLDYTRLPLVCIYDEGNIVWAGEQGSLLGVSPAIGKVSYSSECDNCNIAADGSITVTINDNEGEGSLRWAIDCANKTPGSQTIRFDLSGNDRIISPTTPLPDIIDDGTHIINTLPSSFSGESSYIILDGSNLSGASSGLSYDGADNCILKGLIIQNFPDNGLVADNSDGLKIGATEYSPSETFSKYQNIFRANGRDRTFGSGIRVDESVDSDYGNNLFENNRFAGANFFRSGNGDLSFMFNNLFEDNVVGIYLNETNNFAIEENELRNNNKSTDLSNNPGNSRDIEDYLEASAIVLGKNADNNVISNNHIHLHDNHAIVVGDAATGNNFYNNLMFCNDGAISGTGRAIEFITASANNGKASPIITLATPKEIRGTAEPGDGVDIYLNINAENSCPSSACQGGILLESTSADNNGKWNFPLGSTSIEVGDIVTAIATGFSSSRYSDCVNVVPNETVCDYGGEFITRTFSYSGTLDAFDVVPNEVLTVPEVIEHYNDNFPPDLRADIYIYSDLDGEEFFPSFGGDSLTTVFVFSCDCDDESATGERFCSQTFLGNEFAVFNEEGDRRYDYYFFVVLGPQGSSYDLNVFPDGPCNDPFEQIQCGVPLTNENLSNESNTYDIFGSDGSKNPYTNYGGDRDLEGNDRDFGFEITEPSIVDISFSAESNLTLFLFGSLCNKDLISFSEISINGGVSNIEGLRLDAGQYFLIVDSEFDVTNSTFSLSINCTPDDEGGYGLFTFADELECMGLSDDSTLHKLILEQLNNSEIDDEVITSRDQLAARYLDEKNIYRTADLKQWTSDGITLNLPKDDEGVPNVKCGFMDMERINLRLYRTINGSLRFIPLRVSQFAYSPTIEADSTFAPGETSRGLAVEKDPNNRSAFLNVSPPSRHFDFEGGSMSIDVSSSQSWSVTVDESITSWVTLSSNVTDRVGTGSFRATIAQNLSSMPRAGFIYVTAGQEIQRRIYISQGIACAAPIVSANTRQIIPCSQNSIVLQPEIQPYPEDLNYTWRDGAGQLLGTNPTLTVIEEGDYYFTAFPEGNPNCGSEPLIIDVKFQPRVTISDPILDEPSCFGENDGSITIFVSGGTGTRSIEWAEDPRTSNVLDQLSAGTYNVTARDEFGCSDSRMITLGQPTQIMANASSTPATNDMSMDGQAIVFPSGSVTGEYDVRWEDNTRGMLLDSLSPGTYHYTITDGNNCQITGEVEVGSQCTVPQLSTPEELVYLRCDQNNLDLIANISNPTPDQTFNWKDQGGNIISQNLSVTISSAGVYTFTAINPQGCSSSLNVNVEDPPLPTLAINTNSVSCNGLADGSAIGLASGGMGDLVIKWPDNSTGANLEGLEAKIYSATVTDGNGCQDIEAFEIQEPPSLSVSIESSSPTQEDSSDGFIKLTPSGGNGGYSIQWANSDFTGFDYQGLLDGNYAFTITDSKGCSFPDEVSLVKRCFPPQLSLISNSTVIPCNPNQLILEADLQSGFEQEDFYWTDDEDNILSRAKTLQVNTPGRYTFVGKDANREACAASLPVHVTAAPELRIFPGLENPANCFGSNDGSASVVILGGSDPVNIRWPNGDQDENTDQLSAGTYTVIAEDIFGCTDFTEITISQPDSISANAAAIAPSMLNASDGSAFVNPAGGTKPYTVNWSNGVSGADSIFNLSEGSYAYTITDQNNCTTNGSVVVNSTRCTNLFDAQVVPASCAGVADGQVKIVSSNNPNAVFTTIWGDDLRLNERLQLSVGTYPLLIEEEGGCSSNLLVTIGSLDQTPPELLANTPILEIFVDEDGEFQVDQNLLASFFMDNCSEVSVDMDLNNIDCGARLLNVAFTAKDASGNELKGTLASSIRDTIPPKIECPENIISPTCVVQYDLPTVSDNCSAGEPQLQGGFLPGRSFPNGITEVIYSVRDAANNISNCSFTVAAVNDIRIDNISILPACFDETPGEIEITASGGTGNLKIIWDGFLESNRIESLSGGTFKAKISDQAQCELTSILRIPYSPPIVIDSVVTQSANANGGSSMEVFFQGGAPPFLVRWYDEAGNQVAQGEKVDGLPSGVYSFDILDANDCILSSQAENILVTSQENELEEKVAFNVFPNPALEEVYLRVDVPQRTNIQLELKNYLGQLILQKTMQDQTALRERMDISMLPAGIYYISLYIDGFTKTKKLIIQNP